MQGITPYLIYTSAYLSTKPLVRNAALFVTSGYAALGQPNIEEGHQTAETSQANDSLGEKEKSS